MWVYVDGVLRVDMGGIHPLETDKVSLDTLGLTVGNTYLLDIFFAKRGSARTFGGIQLQVSVCARHGIA